MNDAAEQAAPAPVLNTDTLFGDLRDAILMRLKAMPKPWTVMSETEQYNMIAGVERATEHLISAAVHLIAANGHPVIRAKLDSLSCKDGIKAAVALSRHDAQRHQLMDAVGKPVLLVVADPDAFMGAKAEAKPDPQQPPLPMGEGDNVAPLKPRD
jgi:hypothetical protein